MLYFYTSSPIVKPVCRFVSEKVLRTGKFFAVIIHWQSCKIVVLYFFTFLFLYKYNCVTCKKVFAVQGTVAK